MLRVDSILFFHWAIKLIFTFDWVGTMQISTLTPTGLGCSAEHLAKAQPGREVNFGPIREAPAAGPPVRVTQQKREAGIMEALLSESAANAPAALDKKSCSTRKSYRCRSGVTESLTLTQIRPD